MFTGRAGPKKKLPSAHIAGAARLDSSFQLRHFVLRATRRAVKAFALYLQVPIFLRANMFKFSRLTSCAVILSAIALGGCGMMPMPSNPVARLSGANEVPATVTSGSGTLEASLDRQTNVLSWTVIYSGLSGPATAGHFHGPAMAGQNAGVVLPFSGSVESPIKGTATLTATQAADVRAGKWYVNLHTKANPGGEIRAQLNVKQ